MRLNNPARDYDSDDSHIFSLTDSNQKDFLYIGIIDGTLICAPFGRTGAAVISFPEFK
jgi:hypothetical protein